MHEIEAKILEIDAVDIQRKLISLGAVKTFDGDVEWTTFDFPDRRLSQDDMLFRLRKRGETNEVTLKKLLEKSGAKISEETEVTVSDYETMKKIFLAVGLQEKRGYPLRKHRISYNLGPVHFEIDTLPDFPTYMEIEAPDENAVYEFAIKLGFRKEDIKPWGTRELFEHYRELSKK